MPSRRRKPVCYHGANWRKERICMRVTPTDWCENFAYLPLNPELREWVPILEFKYYRETIGREGSMLFIIHPRDHNPPHLHVRYQRDELVINIPRDNNEPFEKNRGTLKPKQVKAALVWCESHRDYIRANWDRLVEGVYANG